VPILSTVSRNEQAKIVSNVHGLAEGNPRLTLQVYEKLQAREHDRELVRERVQKQRTLHEEQDRIDAQRDGLFEGMESQLRVEHSIERLFLIRGSIA
jgi:hypothetical protein